MPSYLAFCSCVGRDKQKVKIHHRSLLSSPPHKPATRSMSPCLGCCSPRVRDPTILSRTCHVSAYSVLYLSGLVSCIKARGNHASMNIYQMTVFRGLSSVERVCNNLVLPLVSAFHCSFTSRAISKRNAVR